MKLQRKNRLFRLPVGSSLGPDTVGGPTAGSFVSKYLVAHYQKVSNLQADLKRLPEKEEFFFLQSDKSFNAFTFIPFICKHTRIAHLYATTYSINKGVITALAELHKEGIVDQITLSVSDTMLKRNPLTADLLSAINKQYPNINVIYTWVHAKVALIKTEDAHYIVEGSGNWSENAAIEQYTFANCKGLFDFRMKLFTEVDVRYKAENGVNVKF